MDITFTKNKDYTDLTCKRTNGSFTQVKLGPSFPAHDLAHYVVEKTLTLEKGFYGYIEDGYSIKELSTKDIIKTLGFDAMIAEIITRNLQSLVAGAADIEDFNDLIQLELQLHGEPFDTIPEQTVESMLQQYQELLKQWNELPEGGKLELIF
jgi:hypothetical protein